jgi:hypothetical protein
MDPLHHCPHNGETTGFGGEGVNLISALSDSAEKAFNGVARANRAMHHLGKGVKREQMVFILHQASDRFGVALLVLAFEGGQLNKRFLFGGGFPDPGELRHDGSALALGNGIHDGALFMDHTPLTWGSRKECSKSGQQALMPICHDHINLGGPPPSQIVSQATPSLFVLFRTGASCQDFFVSLQIDASHRQDDR